MTHVHLEEADWEQIHEIDKQALASIWFDIILQWLQG